MPDRASAEQGRGAVRTAVVWEALHAALDDLARAHPVPFDVVDLGGGTGGFAVGIAELGHQVTVVDPSPDALASLHRRAVECGVEERVRGVQGDATDLGDHVAEHAARLVLCHGVLEVLDDPGEALTAIHRVLSPGGLVSVLVAGRLAAVVSRALAGDFARAQAMLASRAADWDVGMHGPRRYTREEIATLLTDHGFTIAQVDAIRCFSDLVPSALTDGDAGARHALLDLERAAASYEEFMTVASQVHLIAR